MVAVGQIEKNLETWIKTEPKILGEDIIIIGEQVDVDSGGRLDYLGIDTEGNTVIIELKRDKLRREVLAQAIDYASCVATWDEDKLNTVCLEYKENKNKLRLGDYIINGSEKFSEIDTENLTLNETQRILLVGFSIDESLHRMIEWLSDNYSVSINFILLQYVKTKNGEELLAKTVIIPEEVEKERASRKKIKFEMSDEPGTYKEEDLKNKLVEYLSGNAVVPHLIREILLPLCLEKEFVTRNEIIQDIKSKEGIDKGKAGKIVSAISQNIGHKPKDYLRQIIQYDKPNPWEKENYRLRDEKYRDVVKEALEEANKIINPKQI
jgi:hypothetical protein